MRSWRSLHPTEALCCIRPTSRALHPAELRDIAVDSLGVAYVIGTTSSPDFPLVNPVQAAFGGDSDAFVAKLAPDGSRLIYSTYLGGSDNEEGLGIAVDASGAAYVTGLTRSDDFPTMNALQPQFGGNLDAFVAKIAPEGGATIFGTYLGGSEWDVGYSIAVDTAGAAHVTGGTLSVDFPTMNPLQPALRGYMDTFVSKLSPNGAALVHSTYLGGSRSDGFDYQKFTNPGLHITQTSMAITVDLTGATYVTGQTKSSDFPTTTTTSLQARCSGGHSDAFVVKITEDSL